MQPLLDWLGSLPLGVLYIVLGTAAAVENIFPPLPADSVVAAGSFLAARGNGSALAAFLATWVGNVLGAMGMYLLGRRYGAERLERRLLGKKASTAEHRLRASYARYGMSALFLSRFVPAVRAIVPPFAGALRVHPVRALLAICSASALWYGLVSWLGFRLGADWDTLTAALRRYGSIAAGIGGVVLLVVLIVWWRHHEHHRRTHPDAA